MKQLFLQIFWRLIDERLLYTAPWAMPLRAFWSIANTPPTLAFATLKVIELFDRQYAFDFSWSFFHFIPASDPVGQCTH